MRTRAQNQRMMALGTVAALALLCALAWIMPPGRAGCDRHLDCPPRLGRCYVGPAAPGGACGPRCAGDADCASACCRPSALDGEPVCAPALACAP